MKKFLKFALKPQWKAILVILVLVIFQTFFQIEIIDLFSFALIYLESHELDLLFNDGILMIVYTILSMFTIYAVSFLSTRVASNAAYNTREKIFHILMNLPDGEISKFKITGLITRSTRGIYSEQGFIILILEHFIKIPIVFIAIVVEIAFFDWIFAGLFAAIIIVLALIVIFRLKQITEIFFKAKKTYGRLNLLFMSKIDCIVNNTPFNRHESSAEFEKACEDSYDKNVKYQLSQYYLGPILLLVLDVVVVVLLTLMCFGYSIGFQAESAMTSVIIIQYILYFLTTLVVIPSFIETWPHSYATSVRLEEVLGIEDKIITINGKNDNSKRIEIISDDIEDEDNHILVDRKEIIRKFNRILNHHRIKVMISLILITVSTLCIVYAPKVAGNIINLILYDSANPQVIFMDVALLFALYVIGNLFKLPSNRFMAFIGEEIAYNLRIKLFENLEFLDSGFIQKNSKGHILSRMNNDLMNIREFITLHISEIFAQFLSILFVIILILTTDWRLGLIYLITLPIYGICFYLCDVKSKKPYENHQKHLGRMMSYFERSLRNRDSFHERGFEKINHTVSDLYIKSRNISNAILPIAPFLTNLSNIAVYIVGVYLLLSYEISLGTLLAVIIYGHLLTNPFKKVSASLASLETSFSSIKRIFSIIDYCNNDD